MATAICPRKFENRAAGISVVMAELRPPKWKLDAVIQSREWRKADKRLETDHVRDRYEAPSAKTTMVPVSPAQARALQRSAVVTRATLSTARPVCAICVKRDANTVDHIDGRMVYLCFTCKDESVPDPPAPPLMRERVLRALASMSEAVTISELAAAMGEDDERGRARISAALARAIRARLVTYIGNKMDRWYRLAGKK